MQTARNAENALDKVVPGMNKKASELSFDEFVSFCKRSELKGVQLIHKHEEMDALSLVQVIAKYWKEMNVSHLKKFLRSECINLLELAKKDKNVALFILSSPVLSASLPKNEYEALKKLAPPTQSDEKHADFDNHVNKIRDLSPLQSHMNHVLASLKNNLELHEKKINVIFNFNNRTLSTTKNDCRFFIDNIYKKFADLKLNNEDFYKLPYKVQKFLQSVNQFKDHVANFEAIMNKSPGDQIDLPYYLNDFFEQLKSAKEEMEKDIKSHPDEYQNDQSGLAQVNKALQEGVSNYSQIKGKFIPKNTPLSEGAKQMLTNKFKEYKEMREKLNKLVPLIQNPQSTDDMIKAVADFKKAVNEIMTPDILGAHSKELNELFKKEFPQYPHMVMDDQYLNHGLSALDTIERYIQDQYGPNKVSNYSYDQLNTRFFSLDGVVTVPANYNTNTDIPKNVHYHWYGKPMPLKYIKHILDTQAALPGHKIMLFTDNPRHLFDNALKTKAGTESYILDALDSLKKKGVLQVQTIEGLLEDAKKILTPQAFEVVSRIIQEERDGSFNYAACADLTRLISLAIHGGIYLDTDVVLRPISTKAKIELFLNPSSQDFRFPYGLAIPPAENDFNNNNVLMCTAQHPVMRSSLERLINNYIHFYNTPGMIPSENAKLAILPMFNVSDLKRPSKEIVTEVDRLWTTLKECGPGCLTYAFREFTDQHQIPRGSCLFPMDNGTAMIDGHYVEENFIKFSNQKIEIWCLSDQSWIPKDFQTQQAQKTGVGEISVPNQRSFGV